MPGAGRNGSARRRDEPCRPRNRPRRNPSSPRTSRGRAASCADTGRAAARPPGPDVDGVLIGRAPPGSLGEQPRDVWRRQSGAPCTSSYQPPSGIAASIAARSAAASGRSANEHWTGRGVAAVTVSAKPPARPRVPMSSAPERPRGESEMRRNAVRRCSAAAGMSMRRRISPGTSAVRCGPRTKSSTGTCRSPPSGRRITQVPSRAAASAIIGPAGRAVQRLPPTVARFQILNEPSSARQH